MNTFAAALRVLVECNNEASHPSAHSHACALVLPPAAPL
jgi:hypothetical protein